MGRFLSYVDLVGVTYSSPSLATGFGAHLATPLLRKELDSRGPEGEKELTEEEAVKIVRNCMKVLFYRDARSLNKVRTQFTQPLEAFRIDQVDVLGLYSSKWRK